MYPEETALVGALLREVVVVHRLLGDFDRGVVFFRVLLRLFEGLVILSELLFHGRYEDVVAGHIVLRELVSYHLAESRENDEEHHQRDDGRQTRAEHGILLFLVKSHLLLLVALFVIAAFFGERFELGTHPLHRLRVAARNHFLPYVQRRKHELEYDRERDDRPAEHGNVVVQTVHEPCYEMGRFGHRAVRNVERAAVRIARRENEHAQYEQQSHCVYLKRLTASVIYTSHLILPL